MDTKENVFTIYESLFQTLVNQYEDRGLTLNALFLKADQTNWSVKKIENDCEVGNYEMIDYKIYKKDEVFECPSCYDEVNLNETYSLSCGHKLCIGCFKAYASERMRNGSTVYQTKCPVECGLYLSYLDFQKLLDKKEFEQYKGYLMNRIIDQSEFHIWCPGKKCPKVFTLDFEQ